MYEGITRKQFDQFRDIRFGTSNPERIYNPFWEFMARTLASPYGVCEHLRVKYDWEAKRPIWNFQRMGASTTLLEGNDLLFIGGEHEDWYDSDFAIYNDVVIRRWDGSFEIYGYRRDDFQPTDFHTATRVGESIFIIGCIGYPDDRILGTTPVYRLDLESMEIHAIPVMGREPGWIHDHKAAYNETEGAIYVWGGEILETDLGTGGANTQPWKFKLDTQLWEPVDLVRLI